MFNLESEYHLWIKYVLIVVEITWINVMNEFNNSIYVIVHVQM